MEQMSLFEEQHIRIDRPIMLIELFSGIGAQAKALERLGADVTLHRAVEIDKYAVKSYNAVHKAYLKEPIEVTDITKIHAEDLGITDTDKYCYLMTYSFPCTDISNAGLQKGYEKGSGTRSSLLWEVERLLRECENRPQLLLMENVPGVHGKKYKSAWENWLSILTELGYINYWADLNSKNYGIPQNRNRTYCLSVLKDAGMGTYYEFPKPYELKLRMKDLLEDEVDEKYYLSDAAVKGLLDQMQNFLTPPLS